MGRRSIKENKSIYQTVREGLGLTREKAGELIDGMSPERIEKIENERVNLYPDDVKLLAKGYKAPELCTYYCAHECALGIDRIQEAELKDISQIAVETVTCMNRLEKEQDRLFEIIEDGQITPDEYEDFISVKKALDKISHCVNNLQLWVDKAIAEGRIDEEAIKKLQ